MGFVERVRRALQQVREAHERAVRVDTPSALVAEHHEVGAFLGMVSTHREAANEAASVERSLAHLETMLAVPNETQRENIREALRTAYRDGTSDSVPCDECAVIQSNDSLRHFKGCSKREPLSDGHELAPRMVHCVVPQPASGCVQCKDTGELLDGAACPGCMRGYAAYQKRYPGIEDAAQERDGLRAELKAAKEALRQEGISGVRVKMGIVMLAKRVGEAATLAATQAARPVWSEERFEAALKKLNTPEGPQAEAPNPWAIIDAARITGDNDGSKGTAVLVGFETLHDGIVKALESKSPGFSLGVSVTPDGRLKIDYEIDDLAHEKVHDAEMSRAFADAIISRQGYRAPDGCPVSDEILDEIRTTRMCRSGAELWMLYPWLVDQVRENARLHQDLRDRLGVLGEHLLRTQKDVEKCADGESVQRIFLPLALRVGELEEASLRRDRASGVRLCMTCKTVPCACEAPETGTICSTESQKR